MNGNMQKLMQQAMSHAKKQAENESLSNMMAIVQTMLLINIVNRHVSDDSIDGELEISADEVVEMLTTTDSTDNEIENIRALVNLVKTHAKGAVRSIGNVNTK